MAEPGKAPGRAFLTVLAEAFFGEVEALSRGVWLCRAAIWSVGESITGEFVAEVELDLVESCRGTVTANGECRAATPHSDGI